MGKESFEQEIAGFLKKLVNIESVHGGEKGIIDFMEKEVRRYSYQVKRIPSFRGRDNLLASIGEGEKILCFNAHCDTVKPQGDSIPSAREKGGNIYGLGSCDDKASLTSMFFAWKQYARRKLPLKLDFLVSVDEEGQGRGVLEVIRKGYRCDFAVVGEPTNFDIIVAHSGILFFSVKAKGKATHGSSPSKGINAIKKAMRLVDSMEKEVSRRRSHRLTGKPSLNLGYISGGDSPNRVPDECEVWVDIRLMPGDNISALENMITRRVEKAGATLKLLRKGSPFLLKPSKSVLVKSLSDCIKEVARKKPEARGWRGWAESDPFFNLAGAQTVVFGPGKLEVAHSNNEWVQIKEVVLAQKILSRLVEKMG